MVKRGIGAVVLAIIAALLLGYLLKDKGRERQDVVEMNLPGITSDSKIPSLSDAADDATSAVTDGTSNLADNAGDAAKSAGASVVAAAAGASAAVATTASDAADKAKAAAGQAVTSVAGNGNTMNRPGFSIRPAARGEQRDSIDPNAGNSTAKASGKRSASGSSQKNTGSASHKTKGNVVASSSGASKETYRPRLIKERKTRIVSSAQGSDQSKSSKTVKRSTTVTKTKAAKTKASTSTKTTSRGDYVIQLMATASELRAKKLAKTMKNEGYNAFITRTKKGNKTLYRVRVHAGKNRTAALAAQNKMKRRYQKNIAVQNSLVVRN